MQLSRTLLALAASILSPALALTITTPSSGSTVDLTSPLLISWTSTSSDPSSFALGIVNSSPDSPDQPQELATNVHTSSGSYTVPANTIDNYGAGFQILAVGPGGNIIGYSGQFALADGVYAVSTSNGVLTLVSSSTSQNVAPTKTGSSAATTAASSKDTASASHSTAMDATTKSSTASGHSSTPTSSESSSGSSSSSSTSAVSTSSSNSNSNLGFDSAGVAVRESLLVIGAAFAGVIAMLA